MKLFISYLATLIPMVVLDAIWIMSIAKKFYADKMGFLFQKNINLVPVAVFYPIYAVGVLFLAVLPALERQSWVEALWRGALLGLAAYAAYDLTNQATIANWPTAMTVVDILWGAFVTAATSLIAYFVVQYFFGK